MILIDQPKLALRKIIPFLFIILLSHGIAYSQMFYLRDSIEVVRLEKELANSTGTNKINIENQIAAIIVNYDPERSFSLSQATLAASEEFSYPVGKAFALSNIGFYYFLQSEFIKAFQYQTQAYGIAQSLNIPELSMLIYERMGYIYYFSKADEQQIINHYEEARKYHDEVGNKNMAASMLVIIGGGAFRIGNYQVALDYFNRFLRYTSNMEPPRLEKLIVAYSMGDIYFQWREMDKAIELYKSSLALMDFNFVEEMALNANVFLKIGDYYLAANQPDSAMIFINKCYQQCKAIHYTRGEMKACIKLGMFYKSRGEYEKSISNYEEATRLGYIIDSTGLLFNDAHFNKFIDVTDETWMSSPTAYRKFHGKLGILEGLTNLMELYQITNHQDKALKIIDSTLTIKDEILKFQNRTELMELKLKYESENKEQKIELLARENEIQKRKTHQTRLLLFSFLGFLILILLIGILYIRQNRIKSSQKNMQLQQKLLRSQMNPHFIFNSLASIQNSIINEEPEKASTYLARFSKLMRNILDSSVDEFIPLEQEISTIENYLSLQKIRFPEKFDYSISMDETLDPTEIHIPPMLAQPFIENAIEHGFRNKETTGHIQISIYHEKGNIMYTIEDDGIGRARAQETSIKLDNNYKSLATQITRERIAVINKKLKQKISLEIIDLKDEAGIGVGTKVVFRLPGKL
ncbi:MAG: histidine kinase [Bacteroidales bacterium]|nr:histidine kinase [Bacteroidales bacterium]MCF8454307.1 histidine kinase [Bacteroidales bacterium]